MISRLPGGRQVRNLDYEMKTMKLIILMILISANLCSQNIKFSKSKIIFAYTPTTPELADTLTIYNVYCSFSITNFCLSLLSHFQILPTAL